MSQGKAVPYALFNLQERGKLIIPSNIEVYEGMIIGFNSRENDLTVNPLKTKQLTNFRASGADEAIILTPETKITLEKAIEIINNFEKFDRGWYGGCIGTFDTKGNGEFFVPIRSFLLISKKIYIFTGSGIVSKSDPDKEWEETKIKSEHILNYFK